LRPEVDFFSAAHRVQLLAFSPPTTLLCELHNYHIEQLPASRNDEMDGKKGEQQKKQLPVTHSVRNENEEAKKKDPAAHKSQESFFISRII
jgi:hypothetical protein